MSGAQRPVAVPGQAPPTVQGELIRPPAQWPAAIGVIGITFAALGVLVNVGTIASTVFMTAIASGIPPSPATTTTTMNPDGTTTTVTVAGPATPDPFAVMQEYAWVTYADAAVNAALWLWAIFVFVRLLRRRPGSLGGAAAWAWAKLAVTIVGVCATTYVQWVMMDKMMAQAGAAGGGGGGMPFATGFASAWGVITLVISLLMYCAWPVFVLIWARRKDARSEAAKWELARA
jgi:hypothetical protein